MGGLVGGLVMSAWGGPRQRIYGVLLGWSLSGLMGLAVLGLGQAVPVWMAGCFLWGLFGPLIGGCNQAIWQAKVAPDVQGRVFTARQFIAHELAEGDVFSIAETATTAGGLFSVTIWFSKE